MTARMTLAWFLVLGMFAGAAVAADGNWPAWRGPRGDGHSTQTGLPVRWNADSVTWKASLPGSGYSSPAVWDNRIFLTAALENGRQRMVLCVDRNGGDIVWQTQVWEGEPEPTHRMNGWAAATCATDGERVYAFFGKGGGLFCLSAADGDILWNQPLGDFPGPWGTAASPVLVGDLVIQNCDAEANAKLIAFERGSGKVVWQTPRENERGWSSPVLVEAGNRRELVMNGHTGARGYDPETGRELWHCPAGKGRGTPTVTPANGLLHVAEGRTGGLLYTVKPGGNGTINGDQVLWTATRSGGRDLPSPIVVGGQLLIADMKGILTAYDPATGEMSDRVRLGGNFAATPVAYQGLAFFVDEAGKTSVIEPGEKLKVVAQNTVPAADDEIFRSALAPSDGQIFVRSDRVLYCIGQRTGAPSEK